MTSFLRSHNSIALSLCLGYQVATVKPAAPKGLRGRALGAVIAAHDNMDCETQGPLSW
jgi:hypothetical protein